MNLAKPATRFREKLRKQQRAEYQVTQQLKRRAQFVRDQDHLNQILGQIESPQMRRSVFNRIQPFLKFEAHCPHFGILVAERPDLELAGTQIETPQLITA